ncbi:hypothetical protein CTEN210_04498 [Chaetoceros tenuissimus]|uniref:dTMP kinase n=1 Tax=Chaetoceros tenuissimus TaxID=426638 RepID=A0AAD3CL30_9STRA|nr:hypothetical protein CTEN210_04498 [Chaetoceros tenuissimus]
MTQEMNISYDDSMYTNATTHLIVPGLFDNFQTAATLIRMARQDLPWKALLGDEGEAIVSDFYSLLQKVEESRTSRDVSSVVSKKFIIEIEGVDGSGKTSLVQNLAKSLYGAAVKTPSSSLSAIRPLWDHRGGILARAFYFITNYILEYEIRSGIISEDIIVIDRWYASTLAYTVAYRPDLDTEVNLSQLPSEVFQWPSDLHLKPNVMLLLDIDPQVRQDRIENRKKEGGGASRFNPWDDRLATVPNLATNIMDAFKSVKGPIRTHVLNANGTKVQVQKDAMDIIQKYYQQDLKPQEFFEHDPLNWLRNDAMKLGLCDEDGRRCHHALWNLQVSFSTGTATPPVLKTVGLNHVDSNCIYYWSSSSLLDDENCNNGVSSSILWCAGDYPLEFQWRSEGFLTRVTKDECLLYRLKPPNSLRKHISACEQSVGAAENELFLGRSTRNDSYDNIVNKSAEMNESESCTNTLWRFYPSRIEVLRGGPSTRISTYPQRWEWIYKSGQWQMRSILPFTPTTALTSNCGEGVMNTWNLSSMTVAIMGSHAAGKSTIGKRLSALLGWEFHQELGMILRNESELVANGHMHGNGSEASNKDEWDSLIYQKECERDVAASSSKTCRVVETWHGGNASWCHLRRNYMKVKDFETAFLPKYVGAISKHAELSSVVLVFLKISSSDVILHRRKQDATAVKRLPLDDEVNGVSDLFELNDTYICESIAKFTKVPLLIVDNTENGEEAIHNTLKSILVFVKNHSHDRVRYSR